MTHIAARRATVLLVAGCGSSSSDSTPTPSTQAYSADEHAALTALHGKCRVDGDGSDAKLYAEAQEGNTIMRQRGVTDETTLSMLQHLHVFERNDPKSKEFRR